MRSLLLLALVVASSCEGPIAVLKVQISGQDAIENGLPATKVEDGWTIKFTKFLIVILDTALVDEKGVVGTQQSGAKAFDLTKKGPADVFASSPPAKTYPVVRYASAADTAPQGVNIEEVDLSLLRSRAASLIVVGTGQKSGVTKTFEWTFQNATIFDACKRPDGTPGLTLTAGKETVAQLSLRGDYLFRDQLSGAAVLRFEAIANADGNSDNKVTLDELNVVQLNSLPSGQYGTGGSTTLRSLKDFVVLNMRAMGHFEGDGECSGRAR